MAEDRRKAEEDAAKMQRKQAKIQEEAARKAEDADKVGGCLTSSTVTRSLQWHSDMPDWKQLLENLWAFCSEIPVLPAACIQIRAEKEALAKKLKSIEGKILKGGASPGCRSNSCVVFCVLLSFMSVTLTVNVAAPAGEARGGLVEVTRKKEAELRKREEELRRRQREEEEKAKRIAAMEEEALAAEEKFSSLNEEAEQKTKKLKKLWKKFQEVRAQDWLQFAAMYRLGFVHTCLGVRQAAHCQPGMQAPHSAVGLACHARPHHKHCCSCVRVCVRPGERRG